MVLLKVYLFCIFHTLPHNNIKVYREVFNFIATEHIYYMIYIYIIGLILIK